jgi:hypothetical protein
MEDSARLWASKSLIPKAVLFFVMDAGIKMTDRAIEKKFKCFRAAQALFEKAFDEPQARPSGCLNVPGNLLERASVLAFLPECLIMIGVGIGETFETVETVDAAVQSKRFGGLVEKIEPPTFKDAEFDDVSRDVFVANFGQQPGGIFAFE